MTDGPMKSRVRIIERGIVLQDFSNFTDAETALDAFREARAFMQQRPRTASLLVLTDVSNSTFNQQVIDDIRALAEHNKPWVRASALYGLTALMRIVLRALIALTRRDIRVFDTREAAIEYLLRFNAPATAAPASPQKPSSPPGGRR
jgi:hypothetical protein